MSLGKQGLVLINKLFTWFRVLLSRSKKFLEQTAGFAFSLSYAMQTKQSLPGQYCLTDHRKWSWLYFSRGLNCMHWDKNTECNR